MDYKAPKTIPDKEDKRNFLTSIYLTCPVSGESLLSRRVGLHHQLHNTAGNRKLYPWFIHSLVNLLPYRREIQDQENKYTISERDAEKYEKFFSAFADLISDVEVDFILMINSLTYIHREVDRKVSKNAKS